jgi:hypothetical protein
MLTKDVLIFRITKQTYHRPNALSNNFNIAVSLHVVKSLSPLHFKWYADRRRSGVTVMSYYLQ